MAASALRWKTTRVQTPEGIVRVKHHPDINAQDLVSSFVGPSLSDHPTSTPPIRHVALLGAKDTGMELAVRTYDREGWMRRKHESPYGTDYEYHVLSMLRLMERRGVMPAERPLAVTTHPDGSYRVVTEWRKGATPLADVLTSTTTPMAEKMQACKEFITELAELHAAGFLQGHPHALNGVRDPDGRTHLIDPTGLSLIGMGRNTRGDMLDPAQEGQRAINSLIDHLLEAEHGNPRGKYPNHTFPTWMKYSKTTNPIRRELMAVYHAANPAVNLRGRQIERSTRKWQPTRRRDPYRNALIQKPTH